jgi:hypothetical protein
MDLNYLLSREQIRIMRAAALSPVERAAHRPLTGVLEALFDAYRFPLRSYRAHSNRNSEGGGGIEPS